jgi:hypothetical protein
VVAPFIPIFISIAALARFQQVQSPMARLLCDVVISFSAIGDCTIRTYPAFSFSGGQEESLLE